MNAHKISLVEDKLIQEPDSYRLNSWLNRLLNNEKNYCCSIRNIEGKLKRKAWLIHEERNSRFFQLRENARRKKKLIFKLKDDCDTWIDDQQAIFDKFIMDCTLHFKSSQAPNRSLSDLVIPKLTSKHR